MSEEADMSNLMTRFAAAAREDEEILEPVMEAVYKDILASEPPFSAIDGGAHRGLHTFPLSRLPNCMSVYAIEANADLAVALEKEEWFNTTGAHTVVISAALQNDPNRESVTFMLSRSHAGRSGIESIFKDDSEVSFTEVVVPATTIDKVSADRRYPVKFIKLDLEGGEWNAVRGAASVMAADRPYFVMEHSIRSPEINDYTVAEYLRLFEERDYQLLTFAGDQLNSQNVFDLWYVWAVPKEKMSVVQDALRRQVEGHLASAGR